MGLDTCTDSFKIGRDKSVNTLGFLMGRNLKMYHLISSDPTLYISKTIKARYSPKASMSQARDWGDTPSFHHWHHVRHELLSSKTRLNGHHQNHVHERDKGNHLLHWCPWLDASTNLGRGGRGGKGRENAERGNEMERKGKGKGERRGAEEIGGKREGKNVRRKICVTKYPE